MITLAICTWNRAEVLRRTLNEVARLEHPGCDWEVLVVNNNCTDHTDRVCAEFRARLPLRLLHQPIAGQSNARNMAIEEARGDYILWTDDDVLLEPRWMKTLHDGFTAYQADWVFGRSEAEWPGSAPSWFAPRFNGFFALLDYGPKPFIVRDVSRSFYGLNFGGSRAAHLKLGNFRSEFGFRGKEGGIGEDIDMFERALKANMTIVYLPDAVVRHIIPLERAKKPYHRRRQWVSLPVYYRHLGELFPSARRMLGLPRFFFSKALGDAASYLLAMVTLNHSERFFYELQLLRFAGLFREAARAGFPESVATTRRTSESTRM